MTACKKIGSVMLMTLLVMTALIQGAAASEIDLNIPMLDVSYNIWGLCHDRFAAPALRHGYLCSGYAFRIL